MNHDEFPPHDVPLRDDVRLLGDLLGEVLREQGGQALLDRVEAARGAAIRRRGGEPDAEEALRDALTDLSPDAALPTMRAFSLYFGLVNMAERIHRVRRLRDSERPGEGPARGSLESVVADLASSGISPEEFADALRRVEVTPVFTAHPTEPIRLAILAKEQRLARALEERIEKSNPTPAEAAVLRARIGEEIRATWQTEEHLEHKTVDDEVEHVVFYLVRVIYRVLPRILETLDTAVATSFGSDAGAGATGPRVRFGSWVGGDMDGNPSVGSETILATLQRQRDLIVDRYIAEVGDLSARLTQSPTRAGIAPAIAQRIDQARTRAPAAAARLAGKFTDTPYRELLSLVRERLRATRADGDDGYDGPEEIIGDLEAIHRSLLEHDGERAGGFRVQRLLRRIASFGFHLATLDVRQDSAVHRQVAGDLLGIDGFADLSGPQRTEKLGSLTPLREPHTDQGIATVAVMRTIREARERFGSESIGPYIISMTEGPDDALAVLLIARAGGLVDASGNVALDVAPLFETVTDLEGARDTMAALMAHPAYASHLAARGGRQLVMVGYSDSAKDSGIAASRWSLIRAQEELAELLGDQLTVFHGRGGSASRGGSRPRGAVLAEPPQALNGRLRVTEQGEIIHAKYGLRGIARRTLELTTGAVLEATARPQPNAVDDDWRAAADVLANASRAAFRSLVHDSSSFPAVFREVTPIDVIERLKIGSRPASRRSQQGIADLRAIPWVFAWTQNRLMLTGWFGLDEGLDALIAAHGLETARDMARHWPFFRNLLADVEMVLAKADPDIALRYFALGGDDARALGARLTQSLEKVSARVLEVLQQDELLESQPVLARAIRLRNPYVDPMNFLQIESLARWRASGREDEDLERVLFTTVKGIARGLQNTG